MADIIEIVDDVVETFEIVEKGDPGEGLPAPGAGDADKLLKVNDAATGYKAEFLLQPEVEAVLPAMTQAQAEDSTSTVKRLTTGQRIWQAINKLKSILGQYDTRTDHTAADGGTVTLDYSAGNAFKIDASALTSGQGFTVAISNWPTGTVFSALSLQITVGADSDLNITWPPGVAAPALTASKRNRYVLSSWDNGTTVDLDEQEAV